MANEKKSKIIKAIAIGVCGALIGGLGGGMIAANMVEPEVIVNTVTETVEVPVEVPVEVEVEKIVEKNVTVEVPVDNGNLDMVLDFIYDNDGNIEYVTDDLDDDEVDQIVERIVSDIDFKMLAANEVDDMGKKELDDEVADNGEVIDRKDIERFRINDDGDEVDVTDVDWDFGDATVEITADFEQDDVDYLATFEVEIRDGEVYDIDVISVKED